MPCLSAVLALCLILVPAGVCQAADTLQLAGVFADRLVLQRDRPVPVWGWANAGEVGQSSSPGSGP